MIYIRVYSQSILSSLQHPLERCDGQCVMTVTPWIFAVFAGILPWKARRPRRGCSPVSRRVSTVSGRCSSRRSPTPDRGTCRSSPARWATGAASRSRCSRSLRNPPLRSSPLQRARNDPAAPARAFKSIARVSRRGRCETIQYQNTNIPRRLTWMCEA